MATPSMEPSMLTELQRAAFEKWKDSKHHMEESSQLQQRSHLTSNVAREEAGDCHVNVTFNIGKDGNVDVLLNISGGQASPSREDLQNALDIPTSHCQHDEDLLDVFYEDEGCMKVDDNLDRPQKLYLYFLELQRLKAIEDVEPNGTSKCGSPKNPYEGGLLELQRVAFEKWGSDEEINKISTSKLASLNLKEDETMQPTMGAFKGDANSVIEEEPLPNEVLL